MPRRRPLDRVPRATRWSPTSRRSACCSRSRRTSCRCRAATAPASSSSPCSPTSGSSPCPSPGADGKSITEKALEVVASGEIKFYPENWVNTYNQWLNNIQDWCISRQLWWGHQIPAWYDEEGRIYVATCEEEASPTDLQRDRRLTAEARRASAKARPATPRSPAPRPAPRCHDAATPGRARHLVLVRPVAVLDARLDRGVAGQEQRPRSTSTCRRRCWSPASTSSSSGWRAWS
jgi:hypothetical protein